MLKLIPLLLCMIVLAGCSNKEDSSISTEDILQGIDTGAANKLAAENRKETATTEEFDEPEELRKTASKEKMKTTTQKSMPTTDAVTSSNKNKTDGPYTVQVNVYSLRRPAERLSEKLSALGYTAYVAEIEAPTPGLSGIQYRVRVGGFPTRPEAEKCGQELSEKLSLEYWIDYRKNDNTTENYSAVSHDYNYGTQGNTNAYEPSPATYNDIPATSTAAPTPTTPIYNSPTEPEKPADTYQPAPDPQPAQTYDSPTEPVPDNTQQQPAEKFEF
jgi:hypothetical protein